MSRDDLVTILGYADMSKDEATFKEDCKLGESLYKIKKMVKDNKLENNYQFFVVLPDKSRKHFIYRYMFKNVTIAGTYDEKVIWDLIK